MRSARTVEEATRIAHRWLLKVCPEQYTGMDSIEAIVRRLDRPNARLKQNWRDWMSQRF